MKNSKGNLKCSNANTSKRGEDENFAFNFSPSYTVAQAEQHNHKLEIADRRHIRPNNLLEHLVENSRPNSLLPYRQIAMEEEKKKKRAKQGSPSPSLQRRASPTKYTKMRLHTNLFPSPFKNPIATPFSREEAENILVAAIENKPDVMPIFIGSEETPEEMKQLRLSDHREAQAPLLPPKLTLQEGADYLGKRPADFKITIPACEVAAASNPRPSHDALLFDWWNNRQLVRKQRRDEERISMLITHPLKQAVRELLTRVESQLLQEFSPPKTNGAIAAVSTSAKLDSLALGFSASISSSMRAGIRPMSEGSQQTEGGEKERPGTRRGVIFPLHAIEGLFRQVRAHLHETVVNLLEAYQLGKDAAAPIPLKRTETPETEGGTSSLRHSTIAEVEGSLYCTGLPFPANKQTSSNVRFSSPVCTIGVNLTCPSNSQFRNRQGSRASSSRSGPMLGTATTRRKESQAMALDEKSLEVVLQSEKELAAQVRVDFLVPSCASLPPERVFAPCLIIETATSVAVLWKILFQACPVISGMSFGLHLYENYILPHLYESFSSYASVIPTLGGLSEQVMQLADLPLRLQTYQVASRVYDQCKADTTYAEYALKHLTLRGWRRDVRHTREREAHFENVIRYIHRIRRQRILRTFFSAWRFEARNSSNMKYLLTIQQKYQALLNGTDVLREINLMLAPEQTIIFSEQSKAKTQLLAKHLAETAVHIKKQPSKEKMKKNNNNENKEQEEEQAKMRKKRVSSDQVNVLAGKGETPREMVQDDTTAIIQSPLYKDLLLPQVVGIDVDESQKSLEEQQPPLVVAETEREPSPPPPVPPPPLPSREEHGKIAFKRGNTPSSQRRPRSTRPSRSGSRHSYNPGDDGAALPGPTRILDNSAREIKKVENDGPAEMKSILKKTREHIEKPADVVGVGETSPSPLPLAEQTPKSVLRRKGSQHFVSMTVTPLVNAEGECPEEEMLSIPSFSPVGEEQMEESSPRTHDLQMKAGNTFEEMLKRLQKMEEVCQYLREEIGVQSKMLRRVEQERDAVRERNKQLEEQLLRISEERLLMANLVQEKQFLLTEKDRRLMQLKSRLRSHRNRPWQKVVMRVVGAVCGSSTFQAEDLDDRRVRKDQKPDAPENFPATMTRGVNWGDSSHTEDESDDPEHHEIVSNFMQEEERLFGKLAPIVLSSVSSLPDATIILQDWANSCLDDLEGLDDLKGGALSVRFTTFSEEARNGILISRLLFYLALPRYLQRTARRDGGGGGGDKGDPSDGFSSGSNYPDRRRQLLRKHNVQLDAPFPVFSECFGDLLTLRPSERMTLLLQFASELINTSETLGNESLEQQRQAIYQTISSITDLPLPPASGRIELQEVIAPHGLALGERASVVTFIALLYIRFAHPFNHKCRQSAELEKAAILHLLSGGTHRLLATEPLPSSAGDSETEDHPRQPMGVEEEILMQLEDEDKSPWQLFKERCLPVFGSAAHPFLLRGNFWPSDAFDSPQLSQLLGQLGLALHHSLEMHRWHVLMSCLVPVMTYSGISRGVFTGPRASPLGLRVGLEKEGQWSVPLRCSAFLKLYRQRAHGIYQEWNAGRLVQDDLWERSANPTSSRVSRSVEPLTFFTVSDGESLEHGEMQEKGESEIGKTKEDVETEEMQKSVADSALSSSPLLFSSSRTPIDFIPERSPESTSSYPVPPPPSRPPANVTACSVLPIPNAQGGGGGDLSQAQLISALMEKEEQKLLQAIQLTSQDLLTLFLRRSTLSAELALPTLHLGGWRLLCVDLKLLASVPEDEDLVPLSYDVVSKIFFEAVLSLNEVARSVSESVKKSKLTSMGLSSHSIVEDSGFLEGDVRGGAFSTSQPLPPKAHTALPKARMASMKAPVSPQPPDSPAPSSAVSSVYGVAAIPPVSEDMTFTAFVIGMVMLANELFSSMVGTEGTPYKPEQPGRGLPDGSRRRSPAVPYVNGGTADENEASTASAGRVASRKYSAPSPHFSSDYNRREKRISSSSLSHQNSMDYKSERGGRQGSVGTGGGGGAQRWHRGSGATLPPLPSNTLVQGKRRNGGGEMIWDNIRGMYSSSDNGGYRSSQKGGSSHHYSVRWLGECLEMFMLHYIPNVAGEILTEESQAVIHRLTMGAATQEVLARFSPAIILVFDAYSKDVYGAAGMDKDDLLQLLRDAMLTSTEISSYLVFEVFQHCCVTRHQSEEEATAKRREIDGKPRDGRRYTPRSVIIIEDRDYRGKSSISGPDGGGAGNAGSGINSRRDLDVLVYEGFIRFLCVLCCIKQPNPLIPFSLRLDTFLRRSVLRPLCNHVENLAPILNSFKNAATYSFRPRGTTTAYTSARGKYAGERGDSRSLSKAVSMSLKDGV